MKIKNELLLFIKELQKKDALLTPYKINNGFCSEVADHLSSKLGVSFCSCMNIEYSEEEKEKMLSTLPDNVNRQSVYQAITRINHDWVFDSMTGLHYDAEIPDGVKSIDDIPIFSRLIARVSLKGLLDFGDKWSQVHCLSILKNEDDIKVSAEPSSSNKF